MFTYFLLIKLVELRLSVATRRQLSQTSWRRARSPQAKPTARTPNVDPRVGAKLSASFFSWKNFAMGFTGNFGPLNWSPRAIVKVREIFPLEYEKCQLKLFILRAEIEQDWDKIQEDIWVFP